MHRRVISTFERLRGQRFGSLVVIGLAGRRSGHQQVYVLRCDCGATVERALDSVRYSLRVTKVAACPPCAQLKRGAPKNGHRPLACCPDCAGLPHRRPKRGACRCGERYQAEQPLELGEIAMARKAVSW